MKQNKKSVLKRNAAYLSVCLALWCYSSLADANFVALDDQEMRKIDGQALLSMSYISPTSTSNQNTTSNIGFYKLGMEAEIELNANIKKLQLGCGGVNGAGACDLDIDYLSLSGVSDTSTGRASSSASITNPFIQFAIKNPESAATREVVGFQLSAEAMQGLLTFGLENGETKSGINSFSGYMVTKEATGTVQSAAVNSGLTQANLGTVMTGAFTGTPAWLVNGTYTSTDYNMTLGAGSGTLVLPSQEIVGKRITSATLNGTATVNGITIGGTMNGVTVTNWGLKGTVKGTLSGVINNLKVNATINEDLGFVHKINLNGTAASLSMQKQNLIWPGAKSTSQTGWWMELSNPIDIGDVTPSKAVAITNDVVAATLQQVNAFLGKKENAVDCGFGGTSCSWFGKLPVGTVDLSNYASVSTEMSNLVLKNQSFAPNCYGGNKFC